MKTTKDVEGALLINEFSDVLLMTNQKLMSSVEFAFS